jgi:homoserine kinase type II
MFSEAFDEELLQEAAAQFLAGTRYKFEPTRGGVNNVVRYIESEEDESRYILRIYNNGNDSYRVRFEHAVLNSLKDMQLSARIPTAVPSITTGESHVRLSSGAEASLFHLIPGSLPKLSYVREIGKASGELSSAFARVHLDLVPPTPPYYELFKVHHSITREIFLAEIETSAFDASRESNSALVEEILRVEKLIEQLLTMNLPKQLIHGDLHYDNVLVHNDAVSGLLDFEFCAMDWRGMELAICLSKYAGENDALSYFNEFIEGFMEDGELTALEVSVIPDLIILRILSNVVYFVGRAIAKEDDASQLTSRAGNYLKRIQWIQDNRTLITSKINECIDHKSNAN